MTGRKASFRGRSVGFGIYFQNKLRGEPLLYNMYQMRKFQVITLFPDMFTGVFENSMMWKAQKDGIVELSTIDLREFGLGPRRQVDDMP